jgi:hypothetical protein
MQQKSPLLQEQWAVFGWQVLAHHKKCSIGLFGVAYFSLRSNQ